MRLFRCAPLLLMTTSLMEARCAPGVFLPEAGPTREAVIHGASIHAPEVRQKDTLSYVLVPLNEQVVMHLGVEEVQPGFDDSAAPAGGTIGVGDVVSVTIFEADSGGLFLPTQSGTRPGNYVNLPNEQVDRSGSITVPYAGTIRIAGMTPSGAQSLIEQRLDKRALEPQVVLAVAERHFAPVSVLGEVGSAAHFSLDPGGERLLGAIARAGGPRYPAYESMVSVQRGGHVTHALLSDIAQQPAQNVQVQPWDIIYVSHEPRYFLSLGATGTASTLNLIDRRIPFSDSHISLTDALAKGGGIEDDRANARGAFVYRIEHRAVLGAIGVAEAGLPPEVPTVFLLDLTKPASFFYASHFAMRNEDIIYVSNAPSTDLTKFLNVVLLGGTAGAEFKAITN